MSSAVVPSQPFRDPRASVSAYFAIACASATGNSLTRFGSPPDVFVVNQSWGWKSSALKTEEYVEVEGGHREEGGELESYSGVMSDLGDHGQ
jgi:hypothetical protein